MNTLQFKQKAFIYLHNRGGTFLQPLMALDYWEALGIMETPLLALANYLQ